MGLIITTATGVAKKKTSVNAAAELEKKLAPAGLTKLKTLKPIATQNLKEATVRSLHGRATQFFNLMVSNSLEYGTGQRGAFACWVVLASLPLVLPLGLAVHVAGLHACSRSL